MTGAQALLLAAVAVPAAMLLACVVPRLRDGMWRALWLAPLPGLAAALLARGGSVSFGPARAPFVLALDTPGAILLGSAAVLWIAAGVYAERDMRGAANGGWFVVCWLATLTGCFGAFLVADMPGFYLFLAVVSLGASGLILQGNTPQARRASGMYLAFALFAETAILMGFVLLAAGTPGGSLLMRDAVAALPTSPWRDPALALLIFGLGTKAALVPLHVWMPLAYPNAPIPAAAVLSGAVVKVSIIGLIRVLPLDAAMPDWGTAMAAAGVFGAYYGVVVGLTQSDPKTVLAYSSVSQMGLLVAVLGMGLRAGDGGTAIAVAFAAAWHLLAKGGLFLAVGVSSGAAARRPWPVLVPAAILALGLGGLPFTGGAIAKLAIKAPLGGGIVATLVTLAAAGTTLLMLHFLRCLMSSAATRPGQAPAGLVLPWLAVAFASIAIPWALYPAVIGPVSDVLAPAALWAAFWPVLAGTLLAVALRAWGPRLPSVPAGDLVVLGERAASGVAAWSVPLGRADGVLRLWPVAGLSLLAVAVALGAAMLSGR
jgi:formate hydrogenlyase subunit 3/multisubunit Na+/H+ antiporter MnhD subunit